MLSSMDEFSPSWDHLKVPNHVTEVLKKSDGDKFAPSNATEIIIIIQTQVADFGRVFRCVNY